MLQSVTGVVLAGGKSSRMGTNKALLPFQGKPLIEGIIERLSSVFSRVLLSTQEEDQYPAIRLPQVMDRYPETGPMGAIASVLETGEQRIFCVACDMPFLNIELIRYLCSFEDCDAVVPVWHGRSEPLHAVYSYALLPTFQEQLKRAEYKISDALLGAHVRYPGEEEIRKLDPKGQSFQNINTPADYHLI